MDTTVSMMARALVDLRDRVIQKARIQFSVSSLVAQAVVGREDVVAPDTGPTAIRDEAGRIVAVRRFQQW